MTVAAMPHKAGEEPASAPRKGRRKFLVLALVVVLALLGAGWFLLRPTPQAAAPKPGEVVALDPIQVNLAGGHYLRIGIALQLTADAEKAEGSKALDATIALFSGRSMEQLALAEQRDKLKHTLQERLAESYEGEVMGVYFTEFVTQ